MNPARYLRGMGTGPLHSTRRDSVRETDWQTAKNARTSRTGMDKRVNDHKEGKRRQTEVSDAKESMHVVREREREDSKERGDRERRDGD